MSAYDLHNNIDARIAFDIQDLTNQNTVAGEIIDTSGFQSIEYVIQSGSITMGIAIPILEESDNPLMPEGTETTLVPASEILGEITDMNVFKATKIGSIGKKRYQRLLVKTDAGIGVGPKLSATAILGNPNFSPIA